MRQLIFILTILLTTNFCFSQTNVFGLYLNQDGAYRQLELRPDFTYNYYHQGPCGMVPAYRDTGVFTVIADTIFLKSNDTTHKPSKYLYISHLPSDKNIFWLWDIGTLAQIFLSDTILPQNQCGRLSDYEALFWGSYVKQQGYYGDGKLVFKTETFAKTKVITNYYSGGQVKSISHYYNDKKTGDWYFYKEDGQLEKIETYKHDKLKRTKKNAL